MEKKVCPHCGKTSYSSMSYTKLWLCAYCDKEFLAVEGEEQGRPVPRGGIGFRSADGHDEGVAQDK